jgi:hypothetical protein
MYTRTSYQEPIYDVFATTKYEIKGCDNIPYQNREPTKQNKKIFPQLFEFDSIT